MFSQLKQTSGVLMRWWQVVFIALVVELALFSIVVGALLVL